ncbi:MAG: OmpA family protein [Chitinispirillaceae bacterium]|nr:OmpA family protein [Chitinispirillaceae bacterium]
MLRSKTTAARFCAALLLLSIVLLPASLWAQSDADGTTPVYSPVVNGEALRGLSAIGSAESMGAGRITFNVLAPWYNQRVGYLTSPNAGANLFTGTGAFSYGVNSHVDLFGSIAGFGMNNYTNTNKSSGLGTIRAGAQGSLPFPQYAFIRMGGQASIIGGTSANQINTYRADGYNYFETRTGYDFMGKLMQTVQAGSEDWGIKLHANEGGVMGVDNSDPALLLLGAGIQANAGFAVLGAEINSRTRWSDPAFKTDPLWFTPTLHVRTPYQMNAMAGIDVSLSADRPGATPRALEPYRVFGALAFSFDMLATRRNAEFAKKEKAAADKAALEFKAAQSAREVRSLTMKSADDSATLAAQKASGQIKMDSMKMEAGILAKKATADSLALLQSASNLAYEKGKRSDAEKQLLSTGELLLDAVYFKSGETIISINSKPYLNIIGKMLLKYPKLEIEVAGHTDNVGGMEYNVGLSQGRADAVRSYLTGVAPGLNLSARGYGMNMPKADNDTKEGRLSNRRVELRVTNRDALQEYSQVE